MKDNTLFLENKPSVSYPVNRQRGAVAFAVMGVVAAYAVYIAGALWWKHPLLYKALPLLFLLAGLLHLRLLQKAMPHLLAAQRWVFTAGLAVAILVLLGSTALWDERLNLWVVLAATGAFWLPFTLAELWQAYADVSFSGIKPWQSTPIAGGDLPASYLHSIRLRFRVIQEPDTSSTGVIPVLASGRMRLCDVFLDMVQKQSKNGGHAIALKSREQEPYTFVFYKTDMLLWYRILDPEKTLLDNGIEKNALIYAQRVSKEAFPLPLTEEKKILEQ